MGLEFLARIRRTSLFATALVSLFAAVYFSYAAGLAVAAGALWSLANLRLLEVIVTSLTRRRARHAQRAARRARQHRPARAWAALLLVKLPVARAGRGFHACRSR